MSLHAVRPVAAAIDESFPEIDGRSPAIQRLKAEMHRVARDRHVTVLLLGESGTGKERIARAIHRASPRASAPFVTVNCAGLPPTLVEDELFGHVRGAFTGASTDRAGPFERATQGTLFLDEIGELTRDLQIKLLRVLQERVVQRLGGAGETAVDVRIVAATNVDLAQAVASGRFREDLYYRLKVYELHVPPLRRRERNDIVEMADAIVRRLAVRRRLPPVRIDPVALDRLCAHAWPGNVRELENTIERMLVAADGERTLTAAHLPEGFPTGAARVDKRCGGGGASMSVSAAAVRESLERHRFNRTRAAVALGLSRHQLYRLIKRYETRAAPGSSACAPGSVADPASALEGLVPLDSAAPRGSSRAAV